MNHIKPVELKPLEFLGSSQKDLREMPAEVRHALGVELMTVQGGGEPSDFKLAAKRYRMIGATDHEKNRE